MVISKWCHLWNVLVFVSWHLELLLTAHSSVLTEEIIQQSLHIFPLPHLVNTHFKEKSILDLKLHCSQSYSEDK